MLRLKGKGLPTYGSYGKGDLLVSVNVWIPKKVNTEEQRIFEKLKKSETFVPKPDADEKSFFDRLFNRN